MVLQKNSIQILHDNDSRNIVKISKRKIDVFRNEIKQYFDSNCPFCMG